MSRIARIIVPEAPHHIVQRGNRNQRVFFSDGDRSKYIDILREASLEYDVKFLAWCLMQNHVHLIAIPGNEQSFSSCFRKAHSRYSSFVNFKNEWRGHLWQYRYHSSFLGPHYLYNALRYAEQNPVRAGIVSKAWDYRWSSAAFHTGRRKNDPLVGMDASRFLCIEDWEEYLSIAPDEFEIIKLRKAAKQNGPVARQWYISRLKCTEGISFKKLVRGRPRRKFQDI